MSAQYESEVVYHKIKKELDDIGVLFTDMDSALRDYPDLVKEHFGTIIPSNDNKFAALNSAVWSGGSFIYVPPGVQVDIPLQAYFRINAENMGQFERTLIIADEGCYVHYVEGCSAPIYSSDSLHSAVVEIDAKQGARVRYTTIQNWSTNVYNLVTKRAAAYEDAVMEWIDGNLGSKLTMKYPSSTCSAKAPTARSCRWRSPARPAPGRGRQVIHAAPRHDVASSTRSRSRKDGGRTTYRGLVRVEQGAHHAKSHVRCDALILDDESRTDTYPYMEIEEKTARIGHEATVSKVGDDQLFYLMSRGLTEQQATAMIVNGFIEPITQDAADGVRGRAEPADRAEHGGLGRMTTFDRAALEALPVAPGFTGAIRARAFEQFEALPTPSQGTEEWRYTDLSAFELDFVPHMPGHGHGVPEHDDAGIAATMLHHNSSNVMTTSGQDVETKGVVFCDLDVAAEKYPELVEPHLHALGADGSHQVHRAARRVPHGRRPSSTCPADVAIELPLQTLTYLDAEGAAVFPAHPVDRRARRRGHADRPLHVARPRAGVLRCGCRDRGGRRRARALRLDPGVGHGHDAPVRPAGARRPGRGLAVAVGRVRRVAVASRGRDHPGRAGRVLRDARRVLRRRRSALRSPVGAGPRGAELHQRPVVQGGAARQPRRVQGLGPRAPRAQKTIAMQT